MTYIGQNRSNRRELAEKTSEEVSRDSQVIFLAPISSEVITYNGTPIGVFIKKPSNSFLLLKVSIKLVFSKEIG